MDLLLRQVIMEFVLLVIMLAPGRVHATSSGCQANDEPFMCKFIFRGDCYDEGILQRCCHTCSRFRNAATPECLYGDRYDTCQHILPYQCYNNYTGTSYCCDTCTQFRLHPESRSGCEYGNRDTKRCTRISPRQCYGSFYEQLCCNSCHHLRIKDISDDECRYGDHGDVRVSLEDGSTKIRTCREQLQVDPASCDNDHSFLSTCCFSCSRKKNPRHHFNLRPGTQS
ncbi:unnamed protein product [Owenia fusiformis]|uniref:Uncharacterized protein n=1 Tax=Owenia fusiformis TaxID=6347 RepID=A0A8J1XUP3_OWEFU|nr:unnamed protein product [Owenia fusiformis]